MAALLGWLAVFILAVLAILLVAPVRYRCEADGDGGFLEISLFFGLYRKRLHWPEEEPAETGEAAEPPADEEKPAGGASAPVEEKKPEPERGVQPSEQVEVPEETKETSAEVQRGESSAESLPETGGDAETVEAETSKLSRLDLLLYAWNNGTVHLLLDLIRKIIAHGKPGYFQISGTAGLGDPMETGVAAGLTYAMLPGICRIDWNYTEKILALTLRAHGRLIPAYLLYIGGKFLAEKPVREMIKKVRS